MVLADDNFATVVAAVKEGRIIFANIIKSIQFLLSCNAGEIVLLFIATMLNWDEPLLPIHILLVNLVTDSLPALALGMDPAEPDIMERSPRSPQKGIFTRSMMYRIIYQGAVVGLAALAAYRIGLRDGLAAARTMSFAVIAFSQLVHSLNVRSNLKSIFEIGLFTNIKLIGGIAASALIMAVVLFVPPVARIFQVVPISTADWGIVGVFSLIPLVVTELLKLFKLNGREV